MTITKIIAIINEAAPGWTLVTSISYEPYHAEDASFRCMRVPEVTHVLLRNESSKEFENQQ